MRGIIFLVLLVAFFLRNLVYASERYFDFIPSTNVIPLDGTFYVTFAYDLEGVTEEDFRIRPVINDGVVGIWDSNRDVWVYGTDLWQDMPFLNQQFKVKVGVVNEDTTQLYFKVQNILTGKIYETSKVKLWRRQSAEGYLSAFNENIKSWSSNKETLNVDKSEDNLLRTNKLDVVKPRKKEALYCLSAFFTALIAGFFFDNVKMWQWRKLKNGHQQF